MAPSQRRRSVDSSSSSSPDSPPGTRDQPQQPEMPSKLSKEGGSTLRDAQSDRQHEPPPGYTPSSTTTAVPPQVPPSGYRIPLSMPGPPFPGVERTREAPFTDADGTSRVFIGSALMEYAVHPCKITPDEAYHCRVSYGGGEFQHNGRYDLLPFVPEHMEFVKTSHGRVPHGRRPVKGGFENDGKELYHAVAVIDGVEVPGKTGAHLGAANIPYGGREHVVLEILDRPFLRPHGRHNYSDYVVICDTSRGSFVRMVVLNARISASVRHLEEWNTQSMQGDRYRYLYNVVTALYEAMKYVE